MIQCIIDKTIRLDKATNHTYLAAPLVSGNSLAHLVRLRVLDSDGEPADLSGISVVCSFNRSDGRNVGPIPASVDGNVVECLFPPSCYVSAGSFRFFLDLNEDVDGETALRSAFLLDGLIEIGPTGSVIDPGTPVPNYQAAITNANAAAQAANTAAQAANQATAAAREVTDNVQGVLDTVDAEGAAQVAAVQAKGSEVLASIPPSYEADSMSVANWQALFARNISDMEDISDQQNEAIDAQAEEISGLHDQIVSVADVVEGLGLHISLNGPNLIGHQPGEETYIDRDPDSTDVTTTLTVPAETAAQAAEPLTFTITDPAITEDYDIWEFGSSDPDVVGGLDLAVLSCTAGSATLTLQARPGAHESAVTLTVTLAATVTGRMLYGDTTRHYACNQPWIKSLVKPVNGQEQDQISEQLALLTGDSVIRDLDGREYGVAVAFTVANAPSNGYNNCDQLIFGYGSDGGTTTIDGETVTYPPSGVFDLEDGQQYSLSCFARITSGEHARIMMGYGYDSRGQVSRWTEDNQVYIDVTGQDWRRVRWTFTWHNTLTVGSSNYTMKKRVGIGICRKYNGTVELAGFRLVAGGLYAENDVDVLSERVTALEARVDALEALALENAGN